MNASTLVAKVWNYAHVLRDDGVSAGDYVEQITLLLFLKMDQERCDLGGHPSEIPAAYRWSKLRDLEGAALERQYTKTLEELGAKPGLIGLFTARRRTRFRIRLSSSG